MIPHMYAILRKLFVKLTAIKTSTALRNIDITNKNNLVKRKVFY